MFGRGCVCSHVVVESWREGVGMASAQRKQPRPNAVRGQRVMNMATRLALGQSDITYRIRCTEKCSLGV